MLKKLSYIFILLLLVCSFIACTTNSTNNSDKQVEDVITLINNIPDEITLDDEILINEAKSAYNELTDEYKVKVTNRTKLDSAISSLEKLKELKINQDAANVVIDKIKLLETLSALGDLRNATIDARNSYDALTPSQKVLVTNYDVLKVKEEYFSDVEYNASLVIQKIEKLPSTSEVTIDDKEDVIKVQEAYDALDSFTKTYVTNYEKLESLINYFKNIENIETAKSEALAFDELVNNLPLVDDLTLDDEESLILARTKYNGLSLLTKDYVTTLSILEALEAKLISLKMEYELKEKASVVINLIDSLPIVTSVKLTDEEAINSARIEYNKLDESVKAYVINLAKLEELEAKIASLKEIENYKNEANTVIDAIALLPAVSEVKLTDKSSVEEARTLYDNLSDNAKTYVTNLYKLTNLENRLINLEEATVVIDLINRLPEIDDLVVEDENEVVNARSAYDGLSEEAKALVTNISILEELENRLEIITSTEEFEVKFYLDGGTITGASTSTTEVLTNRISFKFNSMNDNFFNVSSTEAAVYSASYVTSSGSSYAYNYKVGFSYDSTLDCYVVKDIVESGTGLSTSNMISEYYIIVNSANTTDYQNITSIELGDYIYVDKELSSSSTSTTLDATVLVKYKTTTTSDFVTIKYQGYTVLPIPIRDGYIFEGFFDDPTCLGSVVTEVYQETTLYASWKVDNSDIDTENILRCVSDVATSNTKDSLILENEDATFNWNSSNPALYMINDGIGTVSKIYQTHKAQSVTISVTINYKDGTSEVKTKDIIVNPVLFEDLPDTPVATYFQTSAAYTYKTYNTRYKTEGTLFSDTTKEALDIIYYCFANPTSSGTISISNTTYIAEINKLKTNDVRVILCVDGVGSSSSQAFIDITSDETLLATFVDNVMNLVEQYNFDGVDIDWEAVSTTICPNATGMQKLMKALREEMTLRQDVGGTPYFLSCAIPSADWGTLNDRFGFANLNEYVDYVNMMSYDSHKTTVTSHVAPLYISSNDKGYGFGCAYGVSKFVSYGLDRSKIIIGCAGYGKAYSISGTVSSTSKYPALGLSGTLTNAGVAGAYNSGTIFGNGIEILKATGQYVEYHEYNNSGNFVGSYLYSSTDNIFITYDSSFAIKEKYKYASSMAGVGIMCWAYTEDTNDTVINAIYEAMNE